ncbi:MAG TPA: esterase-like activity of phytase family protein [Candidatus Obscuribacterales bacterium]
MVKPSDSSGSRRWHPRSLAWVALLTVMGGVLLLGGCALPQVSAEERLFLPLTIDLVDVITLPRQTFADAPVGGLSALAYDRDRDRFYALSDDRGGFAPPRFYTLNIQRDRTAAAPYIQSVTVEAVTPLRDETGQPYDRDRLDPEGMALTPRQTLIIASEGVAASQSPPALNEYALATGQLKTAFRLPDRFLPAEDDAAPPRGVRDNLGFEALTLNPITTQGVFEPFRLFLATESALAQDFDPNPEHPLRTRFLHYLIGPDQATFIAEYAYPLSLEPMGAVSHGLSELLAIDQAGHFLALERTYGIRGFEVKLWQLATGGATDISTLAALPAAPNLTPIQKQLVLDFADLGGAVTAIDNLEAMTFGPPFPDGAASLWLISDDNFSEYQTTQVWCLRLAIA